MNGVLWLRLVNSCIAFLPLWVAFSIWLAGKPRWFRLLCILGGLDALLGFALAMVMIWGGVRP